MGCVTRGKMGAGVNLEENGNCETQDVLQEKYSINCQW